MQRLLIVIAGVLVFVGAGVLVWMLLGMQGPGGTGAQTNGGTGTYTGSYNNQLNTSTSVTPTATSSGAANGETTVASNGSGSISVKDFKSDPDTKVDTNNKGHYYLSGGLDPTAEDAPFSILYVDSDQSFNITLLKEPLGDYRKLAEQELMAKLGTSMEEMCGLRYWVSVPTWVNKTYSTKNLGFSFCPGAVQLP